MKPFIYRFNRIFLLPLMLVICISLTACGGSIQGKVPSEIDMGAANPSHESHGGHGSASEGHQILRGYDGAAVKRACPHV
ncbi:hypothetical protein KZ483_05070 [Paenibacillus sp. sptzw28]|uniref:hypothetical protein n=1 Tax=Paenibacillus sp. sptzw28 TaxID=715179 RepID=UPI001C6F3F24|nr:hypothetical protein [Paenibacillus sp. sptzw28]QYR22359.1 hypothetical protein KZ483_05070 [Paenibacillus sp. sptzw28]